MHFITILSKQYTEQIVSACPDNQDYPLTVCYFALCNSRTSAVFAVAGFECQRLTEEDTSSVINCGETQRAPVAAN